MKSEKESDNSVVHFVTHVHFRRCNNGWPPGRREILAAFLKSLTHVRQPLSRPPSITHALSPRLSQTLQRLLSGESEKQIAAQLGLSRHTVHVYVKTLYRRFDVTSRPELLARWIP